MLPLLSASFTCPVLAATTMPATAPAGAGATGASNLVSPVLILVLCVVAGVGTVLLLPGRREAAFRKIGGAIVLAAALILAALLVRAAEHEVRGGMGAYFWIFSAIAIIGAIRVITHPRPVYSALYFVLTVLATAGLFILLWAEFMAVALVLIYAGAILVTYVFVIMLAAEAAPTTASGKSGALAGLSEHDAVSREPLIASAVGFALMGVLLFVIFDRAAQFATPPRPSGRDQQIRNTMAAMVRTGDITSEVFTAPATQPSRDSYGSGSNSSLNRVNFTDLTKNLSYTYVNPYDANAIGAGWKLNDAQEPEYVTASASAARAGSGPMASATGLDPIQELGSYLFSNQLVNLELAGLILTVAMVGAIVIARRRVVTPVPSAPGFELESVETLTAPATPINDNPHSIPVYGTENPRQKAYPET